MFKQILSLLLGFLVGTIAVTASGQSAKNVNAPSVQPLLEQLHGHLGTLHLPRVRLQDWDTSFAVDLQTYLGDNGEIRFAVAQTQAWVAQRTGNPAPAAICCGDDNQTAIIPNAYLPELFGDHRYTLKLTALPESGFTEFTLDTALRDFDTAANTTTAVHANYDASNGYMFVPAVDVPGPRGVETYSARLKQINPTDEAPRFVLEQFEPQTDKIPGTHAVYDPNTLAVQLPALYAIDHTGSKAYRAALKIVPNRNPIEVEFAGAMSLPQASSVTSFAWLDDTRAKLYWQAAKTQRDYQQPIQYRIFLGDKPGFPTDADHQVQVVTDQTEIVLSDLDIHQRYYSLIIAEDALGNLSVERDYQAIYRVQVESDPASGETIDFGTVLAGTPKTESIAFRATGTGDVRLNASILGKDKKDFSLLAETPLLLAHDAQEATPLPIQCKPVSTLGSKSATLIVRTNTQDENSEIHFPLTCTGGAPLDNTTYSPSPSSAQPTGDSSASPTRSIPALVTMTPSAGGTLRLTTAQPSPLTLLPSQSVVLRQVDIQGQDPDSFTLNGITLPLILSPDQATELPITCQPAPGKTGPLSAEVTLTLASQDLGNAEQHQIQLACDASTTTQSSSSGNASGATGSSTNNVTATLTHPQANNGSTGGTSTSAQNPPGTPTNPQTGTTNPNAASPANPTSVKVPPGQRRKIEHDEAILEFDEDALDAAITLNLDSLDDTGLPPLDPGMVNVTKGPRKGYRFLPHGMKFQKNIQVTLPYDKTQIPVGYTDTDVQTYYYDEDLERWALLEAVTVSTDTQEVISLTDHFTDMINAVVTPPDAPQNKSFSGTELKDIKAANPAAGINMIKPPQVSQMGGASLSYPLELPAGRAGVQPQLAVQHQSGGGNGWMGHGWSLSVPSIGIDTRWGVPRYDAALETETYTLNGQQLAPLAHRDALKPREAEKTFRTRLEGGFQRIIRHGDHPGNYWWSVIQKNGSVSYYGGSPETGLAPEAVITDYNGNVFQWFL